jgi:hypothetical protein
MTGMDRPVTLCGRRLSGLQHVCAFFDSRDEQYEVLNPYFAEGIANGEQIVTIADVTFLEEHKDRIRAGSVPVDAATESGQMKVIAAQETYLRGGFFDVDRMYDFLEEALSSAASGPYGRLRTCGDMEWALRNLPGCDELMQFEARVNLLTPHYDCTLLCVYDVNRFSGRAIADVLATHSHVVLHGQVVENPHFVDPAAYLATLQRRTSRGSLRADAPEDPPMDSKP